MYLYCFYSVTKLVPHPQPTSRMLPVYIRSPICKIGNGEESETIRGESIAELGKAPATAKKSFSRSGKTYVYIYVIQTSEIHGFMDSWININIHAFIHGFMNSPSTLFLDLSKKHECVISSQSGMRQIEIVSEV